MPKIRHRQHEILERQLAEGTAKTSTMFLSMEEELRNLALVLEDGTAIRDARIREHVVAILRKTANFCGMHSFQHLGDDPLVLSEAECAEVLAGSRD